MCLYDIIFHVSIHTKCIILAEKNKVISLSLLTAFGLLSVSTYIGTFSLKKCLG